MFSKLFYIYDLLFNKLMDNLNNENEIKNQDALNNNNGYSSNYESENKKIDNNSLSNEEIYEKEIKTLNKKLKKEKILNISLLITLVLILTVVAYTIYYVFKNFFPYYRIARNNKDIDNLNLIATESQIDSGLIDLEDFNKKFEIIDNYVNMAYYYKKDNKKIIDEMFKGYVKGLDDKYAEYMPATNYTSFMETQSGEYYGIGAAVTQDIETNESRVNDVYENSPAEKAGIKVGDVIVSVDGVDVKSYALADIVTLIKGPEGTNVNVGIFRPAENKIIELVCVRGKVEVKLVKYEVKENNVGYISFSEFTGKGYVQFVSAVSELQKKNVKGIVIDLRNNPGGELSIVLNMLDYILKDNDGKFTLNQKENNFAIGKTLLVYMRDKVEIVDSYYCNDKHKVDTPIVILVNGASASASELFTEALRDYDRAIVVGEKTYGKGVMQNVIPLSDGSAIKFTVAGYFPPSGYEIDKNGIIPNYALEYDGSEIVYENDGSEIHTNKNGQVIVVNKNGNVINKTIASESEIIDSTISEASKSSVVVKKEANSDELNINSNNFKYMDENWYKELDAKYEDKQLLQALVLLK